MHINKNRKQIVAIIPARAGSKRLPGKNIKKLLGKPLIAYAIAAARQSKYVDLVVVSTEDKKIAADAKKYGAEVPFLRPAALATDTAPTLLVLQHAVKFLEKKRYEPDIIVLIQPTSPLVTPQDIDGTIEKLFKTKKNSCISVRPDGDPNGAVYATRYRTLMQDNKIRDERGSTYRMPWERSVDVDTPFEFKFAEAMMQRRPFIYAEASVNHHGRRDWALKLIDAAADAGADAIKFQTFRAEDVVTVAGKMAAYQKKNLGMSESQLAMLKKLELKEEWYPALIARAKKRGILFLSTPHGGFASVDVLQKFDVPAFKIGSGDLTNLPLLKYAAQFKKPMIISTGMGTMEEIREAIATVRETGNNKIIVAHCTTNYPPKPEEINLRAMQMMMEELDVPVGYSSNGRDAQIILMAATLGACLLEVNLTLNRSFPGPDQPASFEPDEFRELVRSVRMVPAILGSPVKRPSRAEAAYMPMVRKSVVAARDIKKLELFTKDNLTIKRPGTGMAPKEYFRLLGKRAPKNFSKDTLIS